MYSASSRPTRPTRAESDVGSLAVLAEPKSSLAAKTLVGTTSAFMYASSGRSA